MKLALGLIAKDEVEQFQRIVKDYQMFFDEIVVAVDDRIDEFKTIAKDFPQVKILEYKWINDFADKRNFVHSHINSDYYVRLDMDDKVRNPERLRAVAENAKKNNLSIVYCYYIYSTDDWGNCNAAHWRETIIQNSDNLYWNKKIHENMLPKKKSLYRIDMNEDVRIEHLFTEEHLKSSTIRNIKYLLEEYKQDKEKTDSRTLAYLGRVFYGIGEFDKAIFFLEKHIQSSGWDEDRYHSWCQLADLYFFKENYDQAIGAAFEALQERPDYPDAYLKLHDIYVGQQKWEKAEEWGKLGLSKPLPKTFMILDPSAYTWRPALSMAFTLFQLNKFEEALKLFEIVQKQVPTLDFVIQNDKLYHDIVEHQRVMERYMYIVNYLKDKKQEDKVSDLIKSFPKELDENEVVIKLRQYYSEPKKWSENSVCIFAMTSLDEWSPKSVSTGIGGSEEAVIHLSKELAKLGFDVTVFNNCGNQAGVYNGVKYVDVINFNSKDAFNVLVSWRVNLFESGVEARNRIVWLHDIPNITLDDEALKTIDKIIVLSQYHKSLLPKNVPEEKIFVSTNGINPEDFNGINEIREPHRIIYASSYNRGLEQLLEMWADIRKEVPDASLHIYYGWETYDSFVKEGVVRDGGFKEHMSRLMSQEGVYHHGRVGHKELLKEYAKSGVFAYPCTYAGEINCIALTKAVASGCAVVTNEFAVLAERNPYYIPGDDKFKYTLIQMLKGKFVKDRVDIKKYIQDNSWESVAKDWKENLFPQKIATIIEDRLVWIRSKCKETDKIVDIGCAEGHTFNYTNFDVTSFDIDDHSYLPKFVRGNAESLPFKDKEFDTSVLCEILEHCKDPQKVIKEALRVSKRVITTVPYEYEWAERNKPLEKIEDKEKKLGKTREEILKEEAKIPFDKFYKEDNLEHLWHHRFYTPETFRDELQKAGVEIVEFVKIRFGDWSWIGAICEGQ